MSAGWHPASKTEFDIKPKTQKLRHPKPMKTTWPLWVSLTQKFFQNGLWDWKFMEMLTSMRSNFAPKKKRWANKGEEEVSKITWEVSPSDLNVSKFCGLFVRWSLFQSYMFSREIVSVNFGWPQIGESVNAFGHPQLRWCFFLRQRLFFQWMKALRHEGHETSGPWIDPCFFTTWMSTWKN